MDLKAIRQSVETARSRPERAARPDAGPAFRRRSSGVLALLFGLVLACGPSSPPTESEPRSASEWFDTVLTDRPVIVAPGRGFHSPADESGHWQTQELGTIMVFRSEVPTEDDRCRIEMTADRSTFELADSLSVHLDGVPIELERMPPSTLRVDFPIPASGPGLHPLDLRQPPSVDSEPILFTSMAWDCSSSSTFELRPIDPLDHYLASFLGTGVFPSRDSSASGFAMDSTQTARVEIPDGAVAVRFLVSSAPTESMLRLVAGKRSTEAGAAGGVTELRLELPPDASSLVAKTEPRGTDGGMWFWNGPLWEREGTEPARLVLLLSLDTFRRDLLDAYRENPLGITPHLDRLARSSTVYERAWSTSPWTLPSHASLFTGLFPREHGVGVTRGPLPPDRDTLAEELRARGWTTLGICGGTLCHSRLGLGQGFLRYVNPEGPELPAREAVDRAVALLDEHRHRGRLDGDTLLFLNLFDPHFPYQAPDFEPPALAMGAAERILRGDFRTFENLIEGRLHLDGREEAWIREAYRAEATETDLQVGRLVAELERRGLWRDALVVVTSDHGELLGEQGFWEHSSRLDRELVHVPMMVRSPGQTEGRRVATTVSGVDVFPTVLRFAGLGQPEHPPASGLDLRNSDALRARTRVSAEEHQAPFHVLRDSMKHGDHAILFVRDDRLTLRTDEGARCFQLRDSGWDLRHCPGVPPLALDEWRLEEVVTDGIDPALRRRMEALGYVTD